MIEDINNSREITLDSTISVCPLQTGKVPLAEIIYEKNTNSDSQKFNGKNSRELDNKNVVLRFDGEDGLEYLDSLIEDLLSIRQHLENSSKSNCTMCRHHYTGFDGTHNYCDLFENYTEIKNIYETCLNFENEE